MRHTSIYSALAVLVPAATGEATTINFDNPPTGLVANGSGKGSPVNADAELTDQYESLGVTFSTIGGSPFVALVDLGTGTPSQPNGIGGVNSSGNVDYALDTDIFLVVPDTLTPGVTDSISIQGDSIPSYGNVVFTAYDINGNEISSGTVEDTGGNTFAISAPGIHELQLHSTNGDVAYDNLTFDVPTAPPSVSGVPEPASVGFLALPLMAAIAWKRNRGYGSPASRRRSQA